MFNVQTKKMNQRIYQIYTATKTRMAFQKENQKTPSKMIMTVGIGCALNVKVKEFPAAEGRRKLY